MVSAQSYCNISEKFEGVLVIVIKLKSFN